MATKAQMIALENQINKLKLDLEAREKAQECDAITYNGKIDLKAVDEKLGTHYMELGPYGADAVPEWMQPLMNGSRIHI